MSNAEEMRDNLEMATQKARLAEEARLATVKGKEQVEAKLKKAQSVLASKEKALEA